jgi:nitric oxide reductase subunit B
MEFKSKLSEQKKLNHLIPYRFLVAAEYWAFANLIIALLMSIPIINRYTHGTHITVAHAMIATIGINTMILLGSIGYIMNIDKSSVKSKKTIIKAYWHLQISLGLFGLSLIVAGLIKAYQANANPSLTFQQIMQPVIIVLKFFLLSGIWLAFSLGSIAISYFKFLNSKIIYNDKREKYSKDNRQKWRDEFWVKN